jgi:hypothetical protein
MRLIDVGRIDVMRKLVACCVELLPLCKYTVFCIHVNYNCCGVLDY